MSWHRSSSSYRSANFVCIQLVVQTQPTEVFVPNLMLAQRMYVDMVHCTRHVEDTFWLQVISVAKWRGSQIAQIAQGIGQHAWVQLKDLVASSLSITLAQVHAACCTKHGTHCLLLPILCQG